MRAKSQDSAPYAVNKKVRETADGDEIITAALDVLYARLRRPGEVMSSPETVSNYLTLKFAELQHEVFTVMFLDSQNRIIAVEELFRGTLNQASVYPREVVKAALTLNAAAVIFSHNHPSGIAEPSQADIILTKSLKEALKLVDVKVLDHIVVGGGDTVSFAERGLV